jgi:DNA replication protein DnaC
MDALIEKKLERLRLTGMKCTCQERLKSAQAESWAYSALLDILLTDELDRRNQMQMVRRLAKSSLDMNRTMDNYDFKFNPRLQASSFRELACCKFIENGENIFLIGPSGVGKSHLANALGHEACRRGFDVLCYRTHKLFDWIHSGRGDGTYKKKMEQIIKIPLLILDDFGLQSMQPVQQEDLYEVICERYEKKSMIITSNRDLSEWALVFSNPLIGSAAMDRLVHKGTELIIDGASYRAAQFKKKTTVKGGKL